MTIMSFHKHIMKLIVVSGWRIHSCSLLWSPPLPTSFVLATVNTLYFTIYFLSYLHFIFWSVNDFEWFFFHVDIHCSRIICWKIYLFSIVLLLLCCQWSVDYLCQSISGFSVLSIDLLVYSFANTITSSLLQLHSKCWTHVVSALWLCSSPSILCWVFQVFCLST